MREIAKSCGVGFKFDGEEAKFYLHFNPDWEWHEVSLLIWWRRSPDGGYNWWTDYVFDGRHRISGPGYPSYAIHEQQPISEDELIAKIDKMVKTHFQSYKQYKNKI